MISLEEAFNKQKKIIKHKINNNFGKCIIKGNAFKDCLDQVWFNPIDKNTKWDKDTYEFRKGKLNNKIV